MVPEESAKMKTPLKTLAGLTLAVAAWMKLAEDLPTEGLITPTVACGLTASEIEAKLLALKQTYDAGRYTTFEYESRRSYWQSCRAKLA